ncbi:MAG: DUF2027 domain-containing protein [Bacteroidales bacterium]|nr:DUF2027 domain-containing protein [Bacteroidales bacterium]
MQVEIGDIVRFLNSVGGGRVVKIEGNLAYVDDDGFETPVLVKECVVVRSHAQTATDAKADMKATTPPQTAVAPSSQSAPRPQPKPELPPAPETAEGEKLNIILGFEPADIKRLSSTTFDAYMVNDSNYYLYFTVSTRTADSEQLDVRYAGLIEPATQIFLFELSTADLPSIDRLAVQAVAFKRDKAFTPKPAIDFEQRFDGTKFARLHCFGANPYFDTDVIAFDIVRDDVPGGRRKTEIDTEQLRKAMTEKARADRRKPKPVAKKPVKEGALIEIDLHADELLDTTAGMSPAEILNYQIDTFRRVMDEHLRYPGQKIVFIHGNGEGVLRAALHKELNYRYKGHEVSDASFREYGFGATMVTIRNLKR